MSLDLQPRQRAMLAEMGVRVWWPLAESPALQAQSNARVATANTAASVATTTPVVSASVRRDQTPTRRIQTSSGLGAQDATSASKTQNTPAPENRSANATLAVKTPVTPANSIFTPSPASDPAALDWSALQGAVGQCRACVMCQGRRSPVFANPQIAAQADWFVLGEPPDEAQERTGHAFVSEAGQLLDNMLKAVGVCRQDVTGEVPYPTRAYLSLVLKCRPALPTAPDAQALQTCAAFLRREIALVQPKVIVSMGRLAMQLLLSEDHPDGLKLPLGKLRGQVWHYQGVPVVVTYPPSYLLRNGQDKARAWEDLCLAADVAEGKIAANRA